MYNSLSSQQKTKLKMLLSLLPFTALFLLTLSVLTFHPKLSSLSHTTHKIHILKNLQTQTANLHCQDTLYPELCISTLSTIIPDLHEKTLPEILSATVNHTVSEVRAAKYNCTNIRKKLRHLTPLENGALDDCFQLFDATVAELNLAISDLSKSPTAKYHDLQTLLSAAMTNQATCLDGFVFSKYRNRVRKYFKQSLREISRQVSNSLSLLKKINATSKKNGEVFPEYGTVSGGYPTWLKRKDRLLLQAPVNAKTYNLTVAQDGSGNYTRIGDALAAAPNNSATRFVIYIKSGAYYEYLEVVSNKRNLMFLGDGIGKTLIKGNRSVIDGWTTFRSSTVGKYFLALFWGLISPK